MGERNVPILSSKILEKIRINKQRSAQTSSKVTDCQQKILNQIRINKQRTLQLNQSICKATASVEENLVKIRRLSQKFIDSEVPDVHVDDEVMEIYRSDNKEKYEASASVNFCNLSSRANNNENSDSSFVCDICENSKEFRTAFDLNNHKMNCHPEVSQPRIQCIICHCPEKFHSEKTLHEHITAKHYLGPNFCPECDDKRTFSPMKLTKHIVQFHQTFTCEFCLQNFELVSGLNHHVSMKHTSNIACKLCPKFSKKFKSAVDLAQHTADAHGNVIKKLEKTDKKKNVKRLQKRKAGK